MNLRRALVGLLLTLSGWTLVSCGSVLAPTIPTPLPTPQPTPGLPIIMAAGDISCASSTPELPCKSLETSDLILSQIPLRTNVVVLPLGDLQYDAGELAEFNRNYERTWGRLNSRARPAVGNHEYLTARAQGYYDYFGGKGVTVGARNEGWYQYDVGTWHFIALNSNCEFIGGCNESSPQYRFLQADLATHRNRCTVAYMHYPYVSSGKNGSNPQLRPLMQLLYNNSVDIVLSGHDHDWELFEPMNADRVADPRGFRLFVVGSGGRDLTPFDTPHPRSVFRNSENYGALRIEMQENAYEWQFVSISNAVIQGGSGTCVP